MNKTFPPTPTLSEGQTSQDEGQEDRHNISKDKVVWDTQGQSGQKRLRIHLAGIEKVLQRWGLIGF